MRPEINTSTGPNCREVKVRVFATFLVLNQDLRESRMSHQPFIEAGPCHRHCSKSEGVFCGRLHIFQTRVYTAFGPLTLVHVGPEYYYLKFGGLRPYV